ncbi:hypothetical protein ThidrDRAFT_2833 [Thiorhodococcus drewsii AZ1]|uniref:Uncharacterized protein n=1 Tax=Thiorhodococcus drewsii AZ1 TaxID=765913 RepID=G2E3H0_9GAMM|nr:hypothetical protein [Thiorhodococcus drewsii]EGV30359.1 hypothetical protein ThidrDRAFT_2833 [Thiorhodococcus drewsii AZ1]
MPHRLTAVLAETTLDAIQLLKAEDSGMSRANWGLAKAALSRRPPVDAASSTEMLTLLGRAADGVIWGIPGQPARAWCDARDPLFWGKRLKVAVSATSDADRLCPMLESANRQAGNAVLRILDSLYVEALDEAAQLERSVQSIHESPEDPGT